MSGCTLKSSNMSKCEMIECKLPKLMQNMKLIGANMANQNLEGYDMNGSNLTG